MCSLARVLAKEPRVILRSADTDGVSPRMFSARLGVGVITIHQFCWQPALYSALSIRFLQQHPARQVSLSHFRWQERSPGIRLRCPRPADQVWFLLQPYPVGIQLFALTLGPAGPSAPLQRDVFLFPNQLSLSLPAGTPPLSPRPPTYQQLMVVGHSTSFPLVKSSSRRRQQT